MRRRASGDASRVVVRRAACRCVPPRMRPRARERADFGHETEFWHKKAGFGSSRRGRPRQKARSRVSDACPRGPIRARTRFRGQNHADFAHAPCSRPRANDIAMPHVQLQIARAARPSASGRTDLGAPAGRAAQTTPPRKPADRSQAGGRDKRRRAATHPRACRAAPGTPGDMSREETGAPHISQMTANRRPQAASPGLAIESDRASASPLSIFASWRRCRQATKRVLVRRIGLGKEPVIRMLLHIEARRHLALAPANEHQSRSDRHPLDVRHRHVGALAKLPRRRHIVDPKIHNRIATPDDRVRSTSIALFQLGGGLANGHQPYVATAHGGDDGVETVDDVLVGEVVQNNTNRNT